MRKLTGIYAGLAGLFFSSIIMVEIAGAEEHPVPDEYVYCTVCHGVLFKGNIATRAPKLTGLSAWYLKSQLGSFKNGYRGRHAEDLAGLEMRPMAELLTKKQIRSVSRLISKLPVAKQNESYGNPAQRGKELYTACAACHGTNARGKRLLKAPNLVIQDAWYLITQLNNYRNNIRGTNDNDTAGMRMRSASSALKSDQDVASVVAYIKSL